MSASLVKHARLDLPRWGDARLRDPDRHEVGPGDRPGRGPSDFRSPDYSVKTARLSLSGTKWHGLQLSTLTLFGLRHDVDTATMRTAANAPAQTWSSQRSALTGFIVGLAITVPATFFALLSPIGEALHPYLVPGTELLRPLAKETATWSGPVNVAVASLANGVIYAIGAGILGALMAILRHR